MIINRELHVSTEYQRGVLTGAAQAYLMATMSHQPLECDSVPFENELMRVVKNALQLQGSEHTDEELLAKLIVFCNEGYLPQI